MVQEVVTVRNELLVQHLEFRRRLARIDSVLFLASAILRGNRREPPVPEFPVGLDTEQALVIFGITRKFGTGKRERRGTRFHTLQYVVLKFTLERFLVHDAHLVLHAESAFHVVDFDRNVGANLSLHHEARLVFQRRRRPQARLGAALGIVQFAITLEANVHRSLEHQLGLIEPEGLHPRGHVHRDGDIEHRARLGRLVATVALPDKAIQPQVLAAHVVHVGHVVGKFRIMRRPQRRRIARHRVHAFLAHVEFTGRHVDVVVENLPLGLLHQAGRCAYATEREEVIQRGRRSGQREVLERGLPFRFCRVSRGSRIRRFRIGRDAHGSISLRPRHANCR